MKQEFQYAIELSAVIWRLNNIKCRLIVSCASLFDGKLDSGRIL